MLLKNYFVDAKIIDTFEIIKYRLYSTLKEIFVKIYLTQKADMRINELSKKTGMSIHTIRYYENLGLIEGKADENVKTNNYKDYDAVVVERLEIIQEAKEVGFTLKEIRLMLESWFGSDSPVEEQLQLFNSKIQEVDDKIRQLKQIKKRLIKVVDELGKKEC